MRDFFAQPLSRAELEDLARRAGGIRRLFAFRSPSFKNLGREEGSLTDSELVDLILAEPRLLRRPLLVDGERVLVGRGEISAAQGPRRNNVDKDRGRRLPQEPPVGRPRRRRGWR